MIIPKVLHRVWLHESPQSIPDESKRYWDKWHKLHPEWELRTWDGTEFDLRLQHIFDVLPNMGARADLLRYEILMREGGVYVDTDVEPMQNIEPLVGEMTAFCGKHGAGCGNFFLGATAAHPGVDALLKLFEKQRTAEEYARISRMDTYRLTGPDLLTHVFHSRWDVSMIEWRLACDTEAGVYTRHHRSGLWVKEASAVGKNKPFTTIEKLKIGAGAMKEVVKTRLGVGTANPTIVEERRKICEACVHGQQCGPGLKKLCCGALSDAFDSNTTACGCVIEEKVMRADQECPYGKWGVDPS